MTHFPEPGQIFADRYRVEVLLGSGGFSRVYLATQLDVERKVALKLLRPPNDHGTPDQQRARLDTMATRFRREAKMLSQLKSPTTITMYDYGQTPDGLLFMVLEYIDGESLAQLIEREGAIAPERVGRILQQTLLGLQEAHMYGMLHRDIKPANIMVYAHLGVPDQVKLLDFGIVKKLDSEATGTQDLTDDSTLIGTPRYMSPEYIRGDEVAPNSDLYSLGLVAYELAMGTRAIQADSSIQIISQHLQPTSFVIPAEAQVPDALRQIINAMMRKDPNERYQSAADVLRDLSAVLPTLGGHAQHVERGASLVLSAPVAAAPSGGAGRQTAMLGVAAALVLVALGMGGVLMSQRGAKPTTRTETAQHTSAGAATHAPQTLSILTTPPGAALVINGQDFGTTPRRAIDPRAVTFPARVTVSLQGVSKTVELKAPSTLELDLGVVPQDDPEAPKVHTSAAAVDVGMSDEAFARYKAELRATARRGTAEDRKNVEDTIKEAERVRAEARATVSANTRANARANAGSEQDLDAASRAIKRKMQTGSAGDRAAGEQMLRRIEAARAKLRKQREPQATTSKPADKPVDKRPAETPVDKKPADKKPAERRTTTGYVDVF